MQNITIERHENPKATHYQGCVRPADGAWLLFIDADGAPSLWEKAEATDEHGATVIGYAPAIPI